MSGRFNHSFGEENIQRPRSLNTDTPVSYRREAHERWSSNRPPDHQQDQIKTLTGLAIQFGSTFLAEHLLAHPCKVLRRQCQVNVNSNKYHLTPLTLMQIIYRLQQQQGFGCLWKGISSVFVCNGVQIVSETVISEVTPFPKEISRHHTIKKHCEHLLLKTLSIGLTTPFFVASLVETVQSDVSSERPGVFNCITEGLSRLMGQGTSAFTKLVPLYQLVIPASMYGLCRYIIVQMARYTVITTIKQEEQDTRQIEAHSSHQPKKSIFDTHYPGMLADFTGGLLADMMLFPLETVLHRLYLQGTRTIIDNTDTGSSVIPINTKYEGFLDCFQDILQTEGLTGFYKGFGALVLQFIIHAAILKGAQFCFEKLSSKPPDLRKYQTSSDL